MAIKVKELKDDAILSIKVNKSYYIMLKNSLYYLFTQIQLTGAEETEKSLAKIKEADYSKMNSL